MKYIILYLASVLLSASLLGYVHGQGNLYSTDLTLKENQEMALVGSLFPPAGIGIAAFAIASSIAKGK